MNAFAENLLFDVIFTGCYQAAFALAFAAPVILIGARYFRMNHASLLRRYIICNALLFGWSCFGNAAWLWLTQNKLTVLDDAPVWASFIPFGRYVLDHAGGNNGWRLLGSTTIPRLQGYWLLTSLPVWILTALSMAIYIRMYSIRNETKGF